MNNFKKNVRNILIITISIKFLGFFYKIILARSFNINVLSSLNLLAPIINLSLVLSSMSIPIVVNRTVSESIELKNTNIRNYISSAVKLTLISSSIIFLFFFSFSYVISRYIYQDLNMMLPLIIMLPLIFFSNLSGIMKSYLESHDKYTQSVFSNLLEQMIKFSLMILIIYLVRNKTVLLITSLSSLVLLICEMSSFTYLLLNVKKITKLRLVRTEKKDLTNILKPSILLTLFSLALTLSSFIEPIIYFSLSSHINTDQNLTKLVYTSLHSFIFPFIQIGSFLIYIIVKIYFSKIAREQNVKTINKYLHQAIYLLMFVELIMLNLSKNHSSYLFNLLYGKNTGSYILSSISIINFIIFSSPIFTMTLEAKKCENILLTSCVISCILGLITLTILALIPSVSIYSIVIGIIVQELSFFIINFILSIKKGYFKISYIELFLIVLNLLISSYVSTLIKSNFEILDILLETSIILLIYYPSYIYLRNRFN